MIVVQGSFRVRPEDRERYVAESLETQRLSRAETGCIEYVVSEDPLDPDRFVLSERWESRAALDAHIAALGARRRAAAERGEPTVVPVEREVRFFEATPIDVV